MISVFYDGKCGLCRREIAYYKRIAPPNQFKWQDITIDASELIGLGVSYVDGLKLLHVQDNDGKLHVGLDAFITIWRPIRGWSLLTKLVSLPVIRPLLNIAYRAFALWRFKHLSHCQAATKNTHSPKK